MTVYLPRAFDERDLARLDALAAAYPFATLITMGDGEPVVSHLPVLYSRSGNDVRIAGHVARPNPHAGRPGRATAILHGPHAYVSPTWYTDKVEQARVPTWNYVVAHLHGTLEWFDDDATLGHVVGALSAAHEARVGGDWRFDMDNPAERAQLRGILGVRLVVDRIDMKSKLSQNHPDANRRAVIDRLSASAADADRDVAAWMRATLPRTPVGA